MAIAEQNEGPVWDLFEKQPVEVMVADDIEGGYQKKKVVWDGGDKFVDA